MPRSKGPPPPVGVNFGKRDMERIGFFAETSWLHGVPYVSPFSHDFRAGATEGRQILSQAPRTKVGLQDCYFEKGPFKRVFEKEAYSNPYKAANQAAMVAATKNLSSAPFVAGAASKKHSTPGDYFGTFAGHVDAMSAAAKTRPPHVPELRNFTTNPGKKGSYGYIDITFNKFPPYMPDDYLASTKQRRNKAIEGKRGALAGPIISTVFPQPCFDANPWRVQNPASYYVRRVKSAPGYTGPTWVPTNPSKKPGNNHDGCFSKFPPHMPEKYVTLRQIQQGPREERVFAPPIRGKTKYTTSVVNRNVDIRVNSLNWRTCRPFTYKYDPLKDG